jgi:hypothetical protein
MNKRRERPTLDTYPPTITLREGRDRYLAENGFTMDTYTETSSRVPVMFGIHVTLPSPLQRRQALPMHDLHHVVTGYGTDLAGEAEISAWETSRGLGPLGLYVRSLIWLGDTQGMLLRPRRTWRAFRAAPGKGSLFGRFDEYERLLRRSVGEVRRELGLSENGLVTSRHLHDDAPG